MVDRTLTIAEITETTERDYKVAAMVSLFFDIAHVHVWTGLGSMQLTLPTETQHTWLGVGELGSIDGILESTDRSVNGVKLTLTGIDNDMLSHALTQDYQGRDAKIWLVYFDEIWQPIGDGILIFAGQMDTLSAVDGDKKGMVTVQCESRDALLRRTSESLLTDEEQQRLWPGDLGLEFVTALQSKEIQWGVPDRNSSGSRGGGTRAPIRISRLN